MLQFSDKEIRIGENGGTKGTEKMESKNNSFNPLRVFFLSLSRMPPALMLLIIIGTAIVVTMMVTGRVSEAEREHNTQAVESELTYPDTASESKAPVMFSVHKIPEGTKIADGMIEQRRVAETMIFNDALTTKPNVVGRTVKHMIPAHSQIREVDLQ